MSRAAAIRVTDSARVVLVSLLVLLSVCFPSEWSMIWMSRFLCFLTLEKMYQKSASWVQMLLCRWRFSLPTIGKKPRHRTVLRAMSRLDHTSHELHPVVHKQRVWRCLCDVVHVVCELQDVRYLLLHLRECLSANVQVWTHRCNPRHNDGLAEFCPGDAGSS